MPEKIDKLTPHMRKRGQQLSKDERSEVQEKFLKSFSMTANVRAACMAAGISRTSIYEWLEKDEQFSIRYRQAELDANDLIRAELFRRAVQGYEKPVVSMGKVVCVANEKGESKPLMERMYSDNLLSLLAKARMPEFREKTQVDVNANVSHTGSELANELRLLSNDQYAQFKSWVLAAKEKQG